LCHSASAETIDQRLHSRDIRLHGPLILALAKEHHRHLAPGWPMPSTKQDPEMTRGGKLAEQKNLMAMRNPEPLYESSKSLRRNLPLFFPKLFLDLLDNHLFKVVRKHSSCAGTLPIERQQISIVEPISELV
jgi:hypothetical protein